MSSDNEQFRLESLRSFRILDSEAEKAFDDLTRLAANITGAPISLISLVDEHRQWFMSRVGLDAAETPREQAFCAHAIQSDTPMIVTDAREDSRFADNPLVTGEPNIRFYAGMPLVVSEGAALGTLCVIDRQPRELSEEQLTTLGILRDAVVSHLELRRSIHEIHALRQLLPVCAWCRNVKGGEDDDSWLPLDEYVVHHDSVTHGICPSCRDRMVSRIRNGEPGD